MMEGKSPKESKRRARPQYLRGAEANPSPGATSGISHPGMNDVMFGRGGDTNYHIGNNSFRHLVESYRERYWASSNRKEKSQIIAAILKSWRTQDPPGRFLAKTDPAKGDDSLWHDVGDQVAGRKASKILSEMRIGKKKAAAKHKIDDSPEQPQRKRRRDTPSPPRDTDGHGVLQTLMDAVPGEFAAPLPATSNPSLWEPPQIHPTAFYSEVAAHPLLRREGMELRHEGMELRHEGMAMMGDPIMARQLPEIPPSVPTHPIQQQLGETIPVAAALTSVFQDQFITSEVARRPSPGAYNDDESD